MNKWQIKDLTGVGDVELELDDSKRVFVLFGSNGVGKTRILKALNYLLSKKVIKQQKKALHDPDFITVRGDIELFKSLFNDSQDVSSLCKSVSYNEEILYLDNIVQNSDTLKLSSKIKNFLNPISAVKSHLNPFLIQDNSSLSNCNNQSDEIVELKRVIEKVCIINTSNRQSISATFDFSKINQGSNISDLTDAFKLGVNAVTEDIANWILSNESRNLKNLNKSFIEALNILDNRIEKTLRISDKRIYLQIDGQERELSQLSSGFTSVVRIIQSILASYANCQNIKNLFEVKGVVLIDEIENHLHLEWQVKIIPTLKKLFPNTIFYIATHSPLVLSQLEEGEAYLLKKHDDGVVRSEIIRSPNKRILANVLTDAFGIDLNDLKRQSMEHSDQSQVKAKLLSLLHDKKNKEGYFSE